jgi:C4-type Zn-finger protein
MADLKECPLCGAAMRLKTVETVVRVPGHPVRRTVRAREWVCADCDYFEEAEEVGT